MFNRFQTSSMVAIDWQDLHVLVVGGGQVGTRRVLQFLAAKANITLISPTLTPELQTLFENKKIIYHQRLWHLADFEHRWHFVAIAVDDTNSNQQIIEAAKAQRLFYSSAKGGGRVRHLVMRQSGSARIAVDCAGADVKKSIAIAQACQAWLSTQKIT